MKADVSVVAAASAPGVRLDVWLWAARFFKTRALAKKAIEGGKVELNEAAGKPSKAVHVGDRLRLARGEERFEIEVVVLGDQRGPVALAQSLYREAEASRNARVEAAERRRLARVMRSHRPSPTSARGASSLRWAILMRCRAEFPESSG